jgi:murein L,D-transpeptidase YafK
MADPARTQRRLGGRVSLLGAIVLVALAGTAAFFSSGWQQPSAAFLPANYAPGAAAANPRRAARDETITSRVPGLEPEVQLVKSLDEIRNMRLENALTEIDRVISAYPNFRLAHLVKGDLLTARTRPLPQLGAAEDAPVDALDDLREEARARFARRQAEPPRELAPRYLLQMPREQRHALVVDTAKSTMYVYENREGEARYVANYYVSIGKEGMDKLREGDNKTPLGVYNITGSLSRETLNNRYGKLAHQYGVGALPIDYPNEWDRRARRTGHGIWIHGVPFDTYSRPPRASNGCVAMTNEDFLTLSQSVRPGAAAVIIANGVEWANPDALRAARQELAQAVEQWRRDWESLNTPVYLKHYSRKFAAGGMRYEAFAEYKQSVNAGKTWLKVRLDNVSMYGYPGKGDLAVVTFDQDYDSSNLAGQSRKRMYWQKEGGGWKIVYEGRG